MDNTTARRTPAWSNCAMSRLRRTAPATTTVRLRLDPPDAGGRKLQGSSASRTRAGRAHRRCGHATRRKQSKHDRTESHGGLSLLASAEFRAQWRVRGHLQHAPCRHAVIRRMPRLHRDERALARRADLALAGQCRLDRCPVAGDLHRLRPTAGSPGPPASGGGGSPRKSLTSPCTGRLSSDCSRISATVAAQLE